MPMEHLRVPKNSSKRVRVFKIELEFAGVGCFLLKYLEKTSRSNGENHQQTQPKYGVNAGA